MWIAASNLLQSTWGFLSIFIVAWISQRIISYWERRKRVEETKLAIYMTWMPYFAECYALTISPSDKPLDRHELIKKRMEILGMLQIMGPDGAMEAFADFCDQFDKGILKDSTFDSKSFHESFTKLNYCLCCEIHGEKQKD
jgi:hypothetical protein